MSTKKQHYIPRMILKHFACGQSSANNQTIYQYDKNKKTERWVCIKDVCRKNNLYEIKDENGNIPDDEVNLIEGWFSRLESKWEKIIEKIERQESLSQDDRYMLGILLVLQLIRTPENMKFSSDWLCSTLDNIGKNLTSNKIDRYMKLSSFVYGKIDPKTNFMLNDLIETILVGRDVAIYHSDYGFILNGDQPVLCLKLYENENENDMTCLWYLPITKNYCIGIVNEGDTLYKDIDKDYTDFINKHNFENNGKFIYGCKSVIQEYVL